ncbi:MAG: hypothetical protein J6Y08_02320 [Clostridiales bacterium]|nr:hypothetical protein [Clostridiales bacterium]
MWHDDNDNIMKLYVIVDTDRADYPFPASCPVCGTRSGHIYMHRYDEENNGGLWLWCSSCHSFSHSRYKIPDWWKNLSLFTILDLEAVPEKLDKQAVYIDAFVNRLLAIKADKEIKKAQPPIPCEKCGTDMIRELPEGLGGGMSITCPKCGWGVATSYFDPILRDTAEYQIKLLEGNQVTVESIRAVNQVAHRNLLKSRQLIESAPHVIFKGDALEVHEKKEILDEESILYKIEPDFPYD